MSGEALSITSLLKGLITLRASDLHLRAGRPPLYRVSGDIIPTKMASLKPDDIKKLAYATMSVQQIKEFETNAQVDFGFYAPGLARFRANVFLQKSSIAVAIRLVPLQVPVLEKLQLPPVMAELALKQRGLLLVTGSTGSGKSTTMAAMINHINDSSRSHIITIEDPVEFVHEDKLSTITQRELGTDAASMPLALRGALRQDPDVIMLGELRDYETMAQAITAAETGHLVISTLHTNSAAKSIDRIIDCFPADAKNQVRLQLATSLLGVITLRLVKRADGQGRIAACEILVRSPSIERLILDNKIHEIESVMENSNIYYKMQTMNQALEKMAKEGSISIDDALDNSDYKEDLQLKFSGMARGADAAITSAEDHAVAHHSSGIALDDLVDGGMLRGSINRKPRKIG